MVSAATRPGRASGSSTLRTIWAGEAPMACAASTSPGSTSRSAASASLATNGMAATVSGTTAAAVPIEVPTTRRVKGMIATSRMMKGVERPAFTTAPSTRWARGRGRMWPGAVTTSTIPSGTPSRPAMVDDTVTITSVCQNASSNGPSIGHMSEGLDHDVAVGLSLDVIDLRLDDVEQHVEAPDHLGEHGRAGRGALEQDPQ